MAVQIDTDAMIKVNIFALALSVTAMIFPAHAADERYPVAFVKKIEIIDPSGHSSWEDKNFLDCADVILTEEDVRYALRHMRRISEKSYFREDENRTGCSGGASVIFKSDKIIVIDVEPSGRITTFESNAKLDPVARTASFYACEPCKVRKMALLKDALNRADERRFRQAEAEGKIPPGQAEPRLKALRESREPKPSKN